jgi:hypothetical protein
MHYGFVVCPGFPRTSQKHGHDGILHTLQYVHTCRLVCCARHCFKMILSHVWVMFTVFSFNSGLWQQVSRITVRRSLWEGHDPMVRWDSKGNFIPFWSLAVGFKCAFRCFPVLLCSYVFTFFYLCFPHPKLDDFPNARLPGQDLLQKSRNSRRTWCSACMWILRFVSKNLATFKTLAWLRRCAVPLVPLVPAASRSG